MSATARRSSPKIPRPVIKSAIEQETKLSVEEHFRLPALGGKLLPRRVLTSTYYDTPNYRLTHAKITLRYRIEHGKGLWQLKLPMEEARREIEIAGAAGSPPRQLQDLLMIRLQGAELIPVAKMRTWRTGIRMSDRKGASADVLLDTVSVIKDGQVVGRFRELEIECLNGNGNLLVRLEKTLRKTGAGDHDGRPKLFRALDIPTPRPPEAPSTDAPAAEHLKFILSQQVEAVRSHDPGTRLGGETQHVHQMRVAVRRLRAILRAARPLLIAEWAEGLRAELAWLGELLGRARDLDVQIEYFLKEAKAMESRDRRPLARFVERLRTDREKTQQMLLGELQSRRYLELIGRLLQAAQEPALVMSTARLDEITADEFAKLRKAKKNLGGSPTDAELHRLRIKTKRARHAAELAETCIGKAATRFIKQAKVFQDVLGVHHDAVVAEKHIREFSDQSPSVRAAFVAGRMVERLHHRRREAQTSMESQWKKLQKRGKKAWR
jgi:CHAD domain-containing protein